MTRRTGTRAILALAIAIAASLPLTPVRVAAQAIALRTVTVNCDSGQTIGGALRRQVIGGGLLVRITGTCNEHVDIFRDDVILRGVAMGATIHGPTATEQAVFIDGAKRVHLQDLLISGGSDGVSGVRGASFFLDNVTVQGAARLGVVASYNASAVLDGCTIRNSASNGLTAANSSTVVVTNSLIEQNSTGVNASRASHVRVGQDNNGTALGPVTIRNNTGNGISIADASASIVVASTIQDNGNNGIYIARGSTADVGVGSFNMVGANTITNNGAGASGILVEGGSATIVGNTITGNGFGVQFINGGNGRLGILANNSYLGNTISNNGGVGVGVFDASSAWIGGNVIQANGTNPSFFGYGVNVSRAGSARITGGNTISDNASAGVLGTEGAFIRIGDTSFANSANTISANGTATSGPSSTTPGGIWAYQGSVIQTRGATTISGNHGGGALAIENSTLEFRDTTTITGSTFVSSGFPGFGVIANINSALRIRNSTAIMNNAQDGVGLNTGSVGDFNSSTLNISGNAALGVHCTGGQSFYSGDVTGVHDNAGGGNNDGTNNIPGCTRF